MQPDTRHHDAKTQKSQDKADRWGDDSFPASDPPAHPTMTGFIATENDGKTAEGAAGDATPEHKATKRKPA